MDNEYRRMQRRADRLSEGVKRAAKWTIVVYGFGLLALLGIFTKHPDSGYGESLWDSAPLLTKFGAIGMIACTVMMIVVSGIFGGDDDA